MLKLVAISDTHGQVVKNLPKADILIHSGDWSSYGTYQETRDFIKWLKTIRHKYTRILCTPGNHDRWVCANEAQAKQEFKDNDIDLLIDQDLFFEGVLFYGMPWTPIFGNWAYMADANKRSLACAAIPENVNVLITHGPPEGTLDILAENGSAPGKNVGCLALAETVYRIRPEVHIFGHIHEGSGIVLSGKTLSVNASHMDEYYKPVNGFKVVYL